MHDFETLLKEKRKSAGEAVLTITETKSIYSRIHVEKGEGRKIQKEKLIKFTKGEREKENS